MNKKIIIIFIIILIIILISGAIGIKKAKNIENETVEEYVPEEEIGENQIRQTFVNLYFLSSKTNELVPESRLIDIKEIINNPSKKVIDLLIEGPKNEMNSKLIPENTKINNIYYEGDCVVIDFSNDFLNYNKENEKEKQFMVDSLVKSLTQFAEINNVKILIDGMENEEFNQIYHN